MCGCQVRQDLIERRYDVERGRERVVKGREGKGRVAQGEVKRKSEIGYYWVGNYLDGIY